MARVRALREANYSRPNSRHSYRLHPDYGEVSHLPRWVVEAAVKDGAAEIVGDDEKPAVEAAKEGGGKPRRSKAKET